MVLDSCAGAEQFAEPFHYPVCPYLPSRKSLTQYPELEQKHNKKKMHGNGTARQIAQLQHKSRPYTFDFQMQHHIQTINSIQYATNSPIRLPT